MMPFRTVFFRGMLICPLILFVSCNQERPTFMEDNGMQGAWSVVDVFRAFTQPVTFNKGEYVWFFDDDSLAVEVNTEIPFSSGVTALLRNDTVVFYRQMAIRCFWGQLSHAYIALTKAKRL